MNPFAVLENVQNEYRKYVESFQLIDSDDVRKVLADEIEHGDLLWKEPYVAISRRWKPGADLSKLIEDKILDARCRRVFTVREDDRNSEPISLYAHQHKSVLAAAEGKNYLVSTGTSSGKSFCFFIPIVNECFKLKGKPGIKAIIVYPMNALANSQYWNIAQRLEGSGLRVGKYTGQTERTEQQALKRYRELSGRETPLDSEVISRQEIISNPPDILITNYKMLEYMLIRPKDRAMLDPGRSDVLKYIVLDEAHTYAGRRGADVALLVRRLKRRMNGRGRIRCVATSATLVRELGGKDEEDRVNEFFLQLFGEELGAYITEEEEELPAVSIHLRPDLTLESALLNDYDCEDKDKIWGLAEALLDRPLEPALRNPLSLQKLLDEFELYQFIFDSLRERPKQISELAAELVAQKGELMSTENARLLIRGLLYLGLIESNGRQLITTKLHTFFQSGAKIFRCLRCNHLSLLGESLCPKCHKEGIEQLMFPLHFCRCCGREFAGMAWTPDGQVVPWDMDDDEVRTNCGYFMRLQDGEDYGGIASFIPDTWLTFKGEPRKGRDKYVPLPAGYDAASRRLAFGISHGSAMSGALAQFPFRLCPSCGVQRTEGASREINKLSFVGRISRCTAINVLTVAQFAALKDSNERKSLVFCDVRQEAALQAGNTDDWYAHVFFRYLLRQIIADAPEQGWDVIDAARRLYESMEESGFTAQRLPGVELRNPHNQQKVIDYLSYCVLDDLAISRWYNDVNLEEVGLMSVWYDGLVEAAFASAGKLRLSTDHTYDLFLAILEELRRCKAFNHAAWRDRERFWKRYDELGSQDYRPDAFLIERNGSKSSCLVTKPTDSQAIEAVSIGERSSIYRWAQASFSDGHLVERAVHLLQDAGFLVENSYGTGHNRVNGFVIADSRLRIGSGPNGAVSRCPKCGRIYAFRSMDRCVNPRCTLNLIAHVAADEMQLYFRDLYSGANGGLPNVDIEDHSGMVNDADRVERENHFISPDHALNVLACSPTMELGIDVGDLSCVSLRNVPPSPSNYVQRSGRAGRRGQGSLITTFCTTIGQSSHDVHFYKHPDQMIAGRIVVPVFDLANEELLRSHFNALVSEVAELDLLEDNDHLFDLDPDWTKRLQPRASVIEHFRSQSAAMGQAVQDAAESLFLADASLPAAHIGSNIPQWQSEFVDVFMGMLSLLADEYDRVNQEIDAMSRGKVPYNKELQAALFLRREDIRTGGKVNDTSQQIRKKASYNCPYRMDQWLPTNAFLPGYAFGGDYVRVQLPNPDDDFTRPPILALREFGPRAICYAQKRKWEVSHASYGTQDVRRFARCPECGRKAEQTSQAGSHCPCGSLYDPPFNAKRMPDVRVSPMGRIVRWEEVRESKQFVLESFLEGSDVKAYNLVVSGASIPLRFYRSARVTTISYRSRNVPSLRSDEPSISGGLLYRPGYRLRDTGEWELRSASDTESDDAWHALYVQGYHDALRLTIPQAVAGDSADQFITTLRYALTTGLSLALRQGPGEIDSFQEPSEEDGHIDLVFYESTQGSAGALCRVLQPEMIRAVAGYALDNLHFSADGVDSKPECIAACYECLMGFFNQREHHLLDRHCIRTFLLALRGAELTPLATEDWQDLFGALHGPGADNERRFLERLMSEGFQKPARHHYALPEVGNPIAEIDFKVGKAHVLVHGSIHHDRWVKEVDAGKRTKLEHAGYAIVEVDIDNPVDVFRRLQQLS